MFSQSITMAWLALKTKISERILASLISEAVRHSWNEWMNERMSKWMNERHYSRTKWWHVCVFCRSPSLFIVWGGLLDVNVLINYPVLFLKMLNLLTMGPFLAEVSSVAFDDCSRSVMFANGICQRGPQNQHIPKPWVHPPKLMWLP